MTAAGAPSSGGSFSVDLARAPGVIRDLEAARDELIAIKEEAIKLAKVDAGSRDSVSIDAARALSAKAAFGPGSLAHAVDDGLRRIESLIDAMNADVNSNRAVEEQNSEMLRS